MMSKSRIILNRFSDIPASIQKLPERLTTLTPPFIVYENGSIDLDYIPLLLYEEAIIDKESYDYISSSNSKYLSGLRESLTVLEGEGFLNKNIYYREFAKKDEEFLRKIDLEELESYENWVSLAKTSGKEWMEYIRELESKTGINLPF